MKKSKWCLCGVRPLAPTLFQVANTKGKIMRNHAITILKELHTTGKKLTATDFNYISNPNQYFCELKNAGLIEDEWALLGASRVKLRYINNQNIDKVKKVLGVA